MIGDINVNFLVLDDSIEISEITSEVIALDKKSQCISPEEQRLRDIEAAIAITVIAAFILQAIKIFHW
ncbi:MAG: hypothetical protein QME45_10740 [Clostridiales bacterium]|nr:hypothetical protein [Clostridiales bacterium]